MQSRALPNSSRLPRSRRRLSSISCPGGPLLLSPRRRLQQLRLLVAKGAPPVASSAHSRELAARFRRHPSRPPPNQAASGSASGSASGPETGNPEVEGTALREMVTAPLPPPEEGRVENLLFPFLFWYTNHQKRAVSTISGFQEGADVVESRYNWPASPPSTIASGQQGPVQGAFSRAPYPTVEPGRCCTAHPDPTSGRYAFRVGSLSSTTLPHHGYVCGPSGHAYTVSGSLASASQSVSMAHSDRQTRLCDSVHPASPKVQGHPVHLRADQRCSCLTGRNRSPAGEGRHRAGPSSRYEVGVLQPLLHCTQERRWVPTNLGPASFEPGPSQATVQNVDTETHFRMHPSPGLVCSNRPEGRVLSCLDSPSAQAVSLLCVRGTGISVQGPSLRAVPVAPRLYEGCGGGPCSHERTRHSHSQLFRQLAHSGSVAGSVVWAQGHGAQSPVGTSGQLGKEQTLSSAEDLFSWYGVGLCQPDSPPHRGMCSVNAELLEFSQVQDSGSTETISEAPGAYGIRSRSNAARTASYEAASALASWPSPEMGVATRHTPSDDHSGLSPSFQPMVGPCISTGRSSHSTGVQACCCVHGCLHHRLGCHVQQAGSFGVVDGDAPICIGTSIASSCLQYALRWATSKRFYKASTYWSVQTTLRPLRTSTTRGCHTLPSYVATRPPSASEVASCHLHFGPSQSCSRRAFTAACTSRRMETPSPGDPADMETLRSRTGRPVCLSRHVPLSVVLFPDRGNPRHRCTGTQLAPGPTQVCISPSEPTCTDTVQSQGGQGAGTASCT